MKKVILGLTALGLVAVAVTIYSCNKDKELNTTQDAKIVGAIGEVYENPFEQYGIWHNECLEYMFSHIEEGEEINCDYLWTTYGVQFFQNVLGDDYVPTPLDELHAAYERVRDIVRNKKYPNRLPQLVAAGIINQQLNLQNLIPVPEGVLPKDRPVRRNNYQILNDYFNFLRTFNVTNAATYQTAHDRLCTLEQEILANYYALINARVIIPDIDNPIANEYKKVLSFMSVSRNSEVFWRYYHVILMAPPVLAVSFEHAFKIAKADGDAEVEALVNGKGLGKANSDCTDASARAKFDPTLF